MAGVQTNWGLVEERRGDLERAARLLDAGGALVARAAAAALRGLGGDRAGGRCATRARRRGRRPDGRSQRPRERAARAARTRAAERYLATKAPLSECKDARFVAWPTTPHPSGDTHDHHSHAGRRRDRRAARGASGAPCSPPATTATTRPARSGTAMFDDVHPALVVRCAGTADVMRAIELARSEGLEIAVRGGSHSIPGFSTTEGVVIDLSMMKGARVDPGTAPRRRPARPAVAGPRRRDAGLRPRRHRRPRLDHRRLGLHPGRRHRLARAQAGPGLRPPRERRRRHRRRAPRARRRRRRPRAPLGAARWRRQLRRRHRAGARAPARRPDGLRRDHGLRRRARGRGLPPSSPTGRPAACPTSSRRSST